MYMLSFIIAKGMLYNKAVYLSVLELCAHFATSMERANDLSQLALKPVTRADERRTEDDGSLMTHRD